MISVVARADDLHLKDGRVISADEVWETGEVVWYRQGKIIQSVAKADVLRVTKPKPAETPAPDPLTKSVAANPLAKVVSPPDGAGKSAKIDEVETRKVSRIFLKGGVQIDADSIWESEDRVGYRLGKMQTFIERSEVERIVRDISVTEQKLPVNAALRYTTGHRGLDQLIVHNSDKYGVDPTLIYLVMREESRFNYRAVSRVGARGLMQLMPDTARRLGVRNIHDPIQNVEAGARYLRTLLEMFNGDLNLTLAGYNAGENAVLKYGRRVPPYRETLNYVWRINTAYRRHLAEERKQK
ncbi:MAG: lytic transglycosylase domain-containing protein [Blastocatellia bacterium]